MFTKMSTRENKIQLSYWSLSQSDKKGAMERTNDFCTLFWKIQIWYAVDIRLCGTAAIVAFRQRHDGNELALQQ